MMQAVRGDGEKESRNLLPDWHSAGSQAISELKSFKPPKHSSSIPQLRWRCHSSRPLTDIQRVPSKTQETNDADAASSHCHFERREAPE